MIFEHHVVSNWLILSNAHQSKGSQKHIDDLWKTLQDRLAILLLLMWLNLVNDTKLPTYPQEGSSHHVVQKIFFFFYDLFFFLIICFWMIFCFVFVFLFFFFNNKFFLSAWLNSAKDIKLPTYPQKGSSHYVVQTIFFFLITFFFLFFLCVFAKRRAQCVIVGITTSRTRDDLKGDMGIQPLRHTSNWWHRVRLISPYWHAFKGYGKTSYTLVALQWAV